MVARIQPAADARPAVEPTPATTPLTRAVVILPCGRMVAAKVVGQIPFGGEPAVAVEIETPGEVAEPLSSEWLESSGWHRETGPAGHPQWKRIVRTQDHGPGLGVTIHWLTIHEPQDDGHGQRWWPIDYWQQHSGCETPTGVGLLSWVEHTTRGHVRDLVRALRPEAR